MHGKGRDENDAAQGRQRQGDIAGSQLKRCFDTHAHRKAKGHTGKDEWGLLLPCELLTSGRLAMEVPEPDTTSEQDGPRGQHQGARHKASRNKPDKRQGAQHHGSRKQHGKRDILTGLPLVHGSKSKAPKHHEHGH